METELDIVYWTESQPLTTAWETFASAAAANGGVTPAHLGPAPEATVAAIVAAVHGAWTAAIAADEDGRITPAPVRIAVQGARVILAYGQGRTGVTLTIMTGAWAQEAPIGTFRTGVWDAADDTDNAQDSAMSRVPRGAP